MHMENKAIHFKGLNGIRAIAAIGVVVSHISLTMNVFIPRFKLRQLHFGNGMADYGVTMFFTLSGFLITYLLLAEKNRSTIDVKNFYIRRILRIWPLYYAYIIVSLIIVHLFHLYTSPWYSLYYIFFAGNIAYAIRIVPFPLINHFWSIGVEEQFYLMWPWLVKKCNNILKGILLFAIIFTVLKLLIRLFIHRYSAYMSIPYTVIYLTRFDCMAIGAIGACLYFKQNKLFLKVITSKMVQIVSWLSILLIILNRFNVTDFINHAAVGCVTLCIIISQITERNRIINLDNKMCEFLGKESYGIYVIHPLVMFFYFKGALICKANSVLFAAATYPVVILLTVFIAYISYEYYEKIFLKAKKKYTVVASAPV
jgi:peptidoglycan/LPS O-acetylase OafA/YrhL